MAGNRGFGGQATRFFQNLEEDNSRDFWNAHKDTYEREVKQPMVELLESLPEKCQPFRLFRMNRDLRFTKDRSPYKTQQGAISDGTFAELRADFLGRYYGSDPVSPSRPTQ